MRKKALRQSIFREIRQSKARFFSILLIILLGVCFYAGIKATGPDMIHTADAYYNENRLMDAKIMSPIGLEEEDLDLIKETKEVSQAEGGYTIDVSEANENQVVRLMSYDMEKSNALNQPRIETGRLPQKVDEIALDNRSYELEKYKIGDTITFKPRDKEHLTTTTYRVVGFINSPLYIDRVSRGNTTIGKGSVDFFGLIPKENMTLDVYTDIYVIFKGTVGKTSYSSDYKKAVEQGNHSLETALADRPQKRVNQLKSDGYKKIEDGKQQLATASRQLTEGTERLESAKAQLADQQIQVSLSEKMGQVMPSEQLSELQQAENKLNLQEAKLNKERKILTDKQAQLVTKEQELTELERPEYVFMTRDNQPSYSEYEDNADRISSIATVFPVFFFMIAALICLTTMTRMVDEKRGEIGTLKALGYSNWEISQKFIVYATLASLIGSGMGLVIGFYLFPTVIFNAYGSMYNLPSVIITYYLNYSIQSVVVALLCTLLSSLIVLRVDLLSTPAVLMRPKAPKPGKRIWLERLPHIWKRLNFNQKVTARNLFRYKQRMLMTVLGIAGCMAMIITGFGLKDSIGDIVDIQFSRIWHYDATVTYNPDATLDESKQYATEKENIKALDQQLLVSQKKVEVSKKGYSEQDVIIDTPKDVTSLPQFITFADRQTKDTFTLDDKGVIINEKLSNLFDVSIGDKLDITDGDDKTYQVTVRHIAENYAMHFMYMTPAYYDKVFSETPTYQVELLTVNTSLSSKQEETLAETLMDTKKAINVTFTSQIGKAMDDTMGSLNIVVWVLIVSAAMLAFIVLYNLTNINISERIRELSTIKVLGFYDKEVTMYVYRENNILTLLGIGLGCLLGKWLHGFVLKTAEIDMMMFPPDIHLISYVYSALLTSFFSFVVMVVMHRRLKKVDMIEALKSNE
ncbi:MAG: FtsX-like permease family protein [Vagococcus sp.]